MTSQRSRRSVYSWQFLILWLACAAVGSVAGVMLSLAAGSDWIVGLALGVVTGNLIALGLHFWRERPPLTPPLSDINVRLMRGVLVVVALGAAGYLAAGALGVPFSPFFPWDGVGLLALCGLAEVLLRRGQSYWAASCLMSSIFLPIAFNAQYYGMSSPANALYLLGILISGLVLGSNGFFGALAAIMTLTALFALSEQQGRWAPVYPVGTAAQSVGLVLFWWSVYAAGAWLSWLFARTLERALQVSRGQTQALAGTLTALTPEASLEHVLQQALTAIAQQLDAPYASLFLHDADSDVISLHAAHLNGKTIAADAVTDGPPHPLPASDAPIWQEVLRTRRPFTVDDVANDPRLRQRALMLAQGIQQILYVPLLSGQQPLGFISINSLARRRYSPDEIELAQALAQQVTLAMQLARLARETQRTAILDERNRMAREIHDTLAQGFTGIVVQLEAADDVLGETNDAASAHLTRARTLARESLVEARRSVYALRPQALEHKPLPVALRDSVAALTAGAALSVEWQLPEHWPPLPADLEADLLRLGQEAVTNALKHAHATHLRLALRSVPDRVELEVSDNGRGFDPDSVRPRPEDGFGLIGMRERATRHGGTLTVTSQPNAGTTVNCSIPKRIA
ncbi:MAG: GAF domain-containing sensor histidine kinase [Anaerolineales bacterium]